MSSRLESLPPEIFNHILSYLIGDETPVFHLEILRVNKGIHAVAKSYLDGNDWIKFRFNYPETLHTATELAIRTYTVTNASIAKLMTVFAVDVRFPDVEPRVGTGSEYSQIKKRTIPSTKRLYLSTMILAADAPGLLRCIRLQDLTDCCRIDPRGLSATSTGLRTARRAPVHGIAYTLRVPDRSRKLFDGLSLQLSGMNGAFHTCEVLLGDSRRVHHTSSLKRGIERPQESLNSLAYSGLEVALWLKSLSNAASAENNHTQLIDIKGCYDMLINSN